MKTLAISNPQELPRIQEYVHDTWLDLTQLSHAGRGHSLVLPLARKIAKPIGRRRLLGKVEWRTLRSWLTIGAVISLEVKDQADVGGAYVNEVVFDEEASMVTVTSDMPVAVRARVETLKITVEETDEVLDAGFGRRLWASNECGAT